MAKCKLAVLFGGVSSEHKISLRSVTTVLKELNPDEYDILMVGITADGRFLRYTGPVEDIITGAWEQGDVTPCILSPDRSHHGFLLLDNSGVTVLPVDIVLPILHGKHGEDGTLQGLLTMAGIPFVGPDTPASANCMDKEMTHIILEAAGIPMARWMAVRNTDDFESAADALEQKIGYPMFVKPASAGSSVGVSKAHNREELKTALQTAFHEDYKAVVEETIIGREIECAMLGNEDAAPSIPGEIEPCNEFYDFEAKYTVPDSKLHIPARIDEQTTEFLRETARRAYHAIGCEGLSRVDFFVTDDNRVILNEINTLPGFTSISMYPKLWNNMGLSISQLLDELIACGLKRNH